jgi:hypothetical protein
VTYDPDQAPDPTWWLDLDQAARIAAVEAAHAEAADALHVDVGRPHIHHVLHAVIETHVALGVPEVTGRTVARLTDEGVRRHAVTHMVAEVLVRALATGSIGDPTEWGPALERIDAADWIGARLARHVDAES